MTITQGTLLYKTSKDKNCMIMYLCNLPNNQLSITNIMLLDNVWTKSPI